MTAPARAECRERLGRLMSIGLGKRSPEAAWHELNRLLLSRGEPTVSWQTFENWLKGICFPATAKRQELLGEVIGGQAGEEIKALSPPPFRHYRQRIATEMKLEPFPIVNRPRGTDTTKYPQAQATCSSCGFQFYHLRRGTVEDDVFFKNKGWLLGKDRSLDLCPRCAETTRKVVHMNEHKKEAAVAPPSRARTLEEGRLVLHAIESHWDDKEHRYQPGWSDVRLAKDLGRDVEVAWVREIRERDFGGVGEDPSITEFIAGLTAVERLKDDFERHVDEFRLSVGNVDQQFTQLREDVAKVKASSGKLLEQNTEIWERIKPLIKMSEILKISTPTP